MARALAAGAGGTPNRRIYDQAYDGFGLTYKLFWDFPAPGVVEPGGADQFSYQLEIDSGERTVRRHWDGPEVSETVRPLLTALTRQARPAS